MVALVDHSDSIRAFLLPELAHQLDGADLEDRVLLRKLRAQVEKEFALRPLLNADHGVIVDEAIVLLPQPKRLVDGILLLVDFLDLVKESRDLLCVVQPLQPRIKEVVLELHRVPDRHLLHVFLLAELERIVGLLDDRGPCLALCSARPRGVPLRLRVSRPLGLSRVIWQSAALWSTCQACPRLAVKAGEIRQPRCLRRLLLCFSALRFLGLDLDVDQLFGAPVSRRALVWRSAPLGGCALAAARSLVRGAERSICDRRLELVLIRARQNVRGARLHRILEILDRPDRGLLRLEESIR